MLTVDYIIENKEAVPLGGYRFRKSFGKVDLSVVGGSRSHYGDFVDNFEVALIDNRTNKFVTRQFFGGEEDVMGYLTKEELSKVLVLLDGDPSPKTGVVDAD